MVPLCAKTIPVSNWKSTRRTVARSVFSRDLDDLVFIQRLIISRGETEKRGRIPEGSSSLLDVVYLKSVRALAAAAQVQPWNAALSAPTVFALAATLLA